MAINLEWEKWKLAFIALIVQMFGEKIYKNVSWVVRYQTYNFCPNLWIWYIKAKFEKNIKKLSFQKP